MPSPDVGADPSKVVPFEDYEQFKQEHHLFVKMPEERVIGSNED
jgi:hypothetical protein